MRELVSNAPIDKPEVLPVRRRELDLNDYKVEHEHRGRTLLGWRNGTGADVSTLLKGNWLLWDEDAGRVIVAYLVVPLDSSDLVRLLQSLKMTDGYRADGTPAGKSVTVGYNDRMAIRITREQCQLSEIHNENPRAAAAVVSHAQTVAEWYRELNPDLFRVHAEKAADLAAPDYRLADSPFTSAIVNRDNVLPYHFDQGNVAGGWSMMLGLKHKIGADVNGDAGYLVIPELDVALGIEDNSVTGFDGQIALHGVTPFRKLSRDSYRYTIVYYAKAGMWRCLPPDEELRRAQRSRTEKERRRFMRLYTTKPRACSVCGGVMKNEREDGRLLSVCEEGHEAWGRNAEGLWAEVTRDASANPATSETSSPPSGAR